MTTTHALLPIAATIAIAKRPVPWKLVLVAAIAAAAPDVDGLSKHFLAVPPNSIYGHRGAAHSLFAALVAGSIAALFHKRLGVSAVTAGAAVAAAMASHGLLDMMTDAGEGVAYLWPVSDARLFLGWQPIHSTAIHTSHLLSDLALRLLSDTAQLIIPMFAVALSIRTGRSVLANPNN